MNGQGMHMDKDDQAMSDRNYDAKTWSKSSKISQLTKISDSIIIQRKLSPFLCPIMITQKTLIYSDTSTPSDNLVYIDQPIKMSQL